MTGTAQRDRLRGQRLGQRLRGGGRLGLAVLAALAMGGLAGEAGADQHEASVLVTSGERLYVRYCSSCHGESGKGDGPVAGALRTPPADLTTIRQRNGGEFPAGEVAQFIDGRTTVRAHGPREMPIWGQRFGEDIVDGKAANEVVRGNISVLIDYLRTIQIEP